MPTRPGPYMASKGRAQSAVAFRHGLIALVHATEDDG